MPFVWGTKIIISAVITKFLFKNLSLGPGTGDRLGGEEAEGAA